MNPRLYLFQLITNRICKLLILDYFYYYCTIHVCDTLQRMGRKIPAHAVSMQSRDQKKGRKGWQF